MTPGVALIVRPPLTLRRPVSMLAMLACGWTAPVRAQTAPDPPRVPLLDHLVGQWTMTGTVRMRPAKYRLEGTWMLQGRFIQLHMEDVDHAPPLYEARVFIGPDTLPGRVLGHWLDNFGAAYSVPPATGAAGKDSLSLDFPYPGGAFHDTFAYDRATDTWTINLDAADGNGGWKRFANYRAARR
jgi:hypothetical protein